MKLTTLIGAGCALTFAALASAGGLSVGDQAPDLGKDVSWIKGESVTEFQDDHVYVLDFWATWCGPCVRAIPHMDEMAEKYEDEGVTVIGVAVWPRDQMKPTAKYVKDKGDDMSYTVAADINGAIAKKYMEATGSNGIPTVMIVDREGVLAWIGHPMAGMDEALAQIVAGTYDIEDAAKESRKIAMLAEKAQPLKDAANAAYAAGEWETVVSSLQKLAALDPDEYGGYTIEAFKIMLTKMENESRAYGYAKEMINGPWAEEAQALNAVAWLIVDTAGLENRDWDLAYIAASKANKMTKGVDPMVLDTLAAVLFGQGMVDKAIETQRKAIMHAEADIVDQLKPALDKYLAAANAG